MKKNCDLYSLKFKSDIPSLEHPIFGLSTKPENRIIEYTNGSSKLKIIPTYNGLPTVADRDILIYCISKIVEEKNKTGKIKRTVTLSAREILLATGRPTNNLSYKRLEESLIRLVGLTLKTNIKTGNKAETSVFGIVDRGGFVRHEDETGRLEHVSITLADWIIRAIEANEILSISSDYFKIRKPLERRLYEIARKHCGYQKKWQIALEKLQLKTGSKTEIKVFRYQVRQIIKENKTPSYKIALLENDAVVFRPRNSYIKKMISQRHIPEWAMEKARKIALEKRWDYYVLENAWLEYANSESGKAIKNHGASFVAFFNKKQSV